MKFGLLIILLELLCQVEGDVREYVPNYFDVQKFAGQWYIVGVARGDYNVIKNVINPVNISPEGRNMKIVIKVYKFYMCFEFPYLAESLQTAEKFKIDDGSTLSIKATDYLDYAVLQWNRKEENEYAPLLPLFSKCIKDI
ncbi:beta-lactoglobulin-like isoform X2 [Tachyglossus aculeatus]|uniref:beta-lactoglobulin-like isoform X2 n=1 Tax=Tachyglossus aculeatus TaxID=9261 RepID=UPI0018F547EE|nr:beta-lactoglobulin-like isoform X2 [Tachyglossus aculeatus]